MPFTDSFRGRTIASLGWASVQQSVERATQLVIGIALARMLSPEEFGLVAMVLVLTGFAGLFIDLGLGAAIVQRSDVRAEQLDAVFWVNVVSGLALTAGFVAFAPAIAAFYEDGRLVDLTRVLALSFVLGSLGTVHRALLTKQLDFKRLALIGITGRLLVGLIGICLAWLGFREWSLVVYTVLAAGVNTLMLWRSSGWMPRMRFDPAEVGELAAFSSHYFGFQTFNYWARNADNLLIGKFLGTGALGLYSRAYELMLFPVRQASAVVGRVLFPALSSIQHDRPRVGRVYLQMCQTVGLLTAPLMVGLAVLAEPFVLFVFGEQWGPMIPVIRLLAGVGFLQSIGTLVGSLYLSQGRTALMFRVGGTVAVIGVAAIAFGLRGGIESVAAWYAAASAIVFLPQQHIALRLVGLSAADLLRQLWGIIAAGSIMGLAIGIGLESLPGHYGAGLRLMILIPFGTICYLLLIHAFGIAPYRELKAILLARREQQADEPVPTA